MILTAAKDSFVGLTLSDKGLIESSFIDVERVGILNDESAQPHQPRLWTRLIAKFYLDLIPNLRQLFVRTQFISRNGGEYFFVRHAQTHVGVFPVLEAKHVITDCLPTS